MNSLLKVLIAGTVMSFMAVPFLFAQPVYPEKEKISFNQKGSWNSGLFKTGRFENITDTNKLKDSTFTTKANDSTLISKNANKKFKMKNKNFDPKKMEEIYIKDLKKQFGVY